jgi:hypothetical protein
MTQWSILVMLSQPDLAGPLVNLGAIGICLVALAIYFIVKDKRYEGRVDAMLRREEAFRVEMSELQEKFRKEQAEMAEKYRAALERFTQALDVVVVCVKNIKGH